MPLLETRFIMARQQPRLIEAPHLDLLPPARRFWKYRLSSCALSALETEVLGVGPQPGRRAGLAHLPPASQIMPNPAVRTKCPYSSAMPGHFVVGDADSPHVPSHRPASAGPARGDSRRRSIRSRPPAPGSNEEERAEAAFRQSAHTSQIPQVREMAMRDLAYLLKRQERREEALSWWQQLADGQGAVYACEELAKHDEWQRQDLAGAIAWTLRGITLVKDGRQVPSAAKPWVSCSIACGGWNASETCLRAKPARNRPRYSRQAPGVRGTI